MVFESAWTNRLYSQNDLGLLDKWAVHLGGGLTHRLTKQDAVMIKENDLAVMYPEIENNGARISKYLGEVNPDECGAFIEVEVREEKEAIMAAFTWSERRMMNGYDRLVIMLDNFNPERCKASLMNLLKWAFVSMLCLRQVVFYSKT